MVSGAQEHPPPPPPPFNARPMLPPSPQYNPPASMSRVPPPPPPPFTGGRELPALPSATRPESSMSISSMLDTAPGKPLRNSSTATNANGTSPTGSSFSLGPQLPLAPSPTRLSNGNGFLSRRSPEKRQTSQIPTNRPFRAYSGGGPQRPHAIGEAASPDDHRFGNPSANPISLYSSLSDLSTQQDRKSQQDKSSSLGRSINRPSSQPNGHADPSLDIQRRKIELDASLAQKASQEENAIKEASLRQANRDRVSSFDFLGRQAQLERQQQLERENRSTHQSNPQETRPGGMHYPFLTQSSVFSEPSISAPRSEKESVIDRLLERSYQSNSDTVKESRPDESHRLLRDEGQKLAPNSTRNSPTALRHLSHEHQGEPQSQINPRNTTPSLGNQEGRPSTDSFIQQLRSTDEGIQNHRSMLALINDNSKRAGRVSPLPQAVQGAQGQKRGPSSDPSIKNEFSRMFAGIGSGVGSTGLNSGASTPFPPSPKQNSEAEQRITHNGRPDVLDFGKSRNGSRIGRRGKRIKEDESKDLEIIVDRNPIRPTSARINKKNRHPQSHHHHINQ